MDNLIAKASIVFIDIFRVDVVAGFLEDIAYASPSHGHQVDSVLKGENIKEVVVEDVADLKDLVFKTFFTSDYLQRRPDTPIVVKRNPDS